MTDNLETTTVKETPKSFPRGDIEPEGYLVGSIIMGSLLLIYGACVGAKKLYEYAENVLDRYSNNIKN